MLPIARQHFRVQPLAADERMLGRTSRQRAECARRVLVAPKIEQRAAAIELRLREQRRDLQRAVVACDRIVMPAHVAERYAAKIPSGCILRVEREQLVERGERVVRTVEVEQHVAAIPLCAGMVGSKRERAIVARKRFAVTIHRAKHVTAVVQRLHMIGSDRERTIHARERFVETSEIAERERQVRVRCWIRALISSARRIDATAASSRPCWCNATPSRCSASK